MSAKINIDQYDYDQSLLAFERQSNDPQITAQVIRLFLSQLRQHSIIFNGNQPVQIAEIACGPGHRTIEYFRDIDFQPGYDIKATDISPTFTGKENFEYNSACHALDHDPIKTINGLYHEVGLITKTFLQAIKAKSIPLKSFSVKRGNAFTDNLLSLVTTNGYPHVSSKSKNSFHIAFVCHCLYYVFKEKSPEQAFERFFKSMADDILADNGIGIFCHSMLKPDTYSALESRFAYQNTQTVHPTPAERQKFSLDCIIEKHCQRNNLLCYRIEFASKIKFSQSLFDQEDIIRDVYRYDELNDDAIDDVQRLLFFTRRSPKQLFHDNSDIGLKCLLDNVLDKVRKDGGVLKYNALQIVLSPHVSQSFRLDIEKVINKLRNTLQQMD